MPEQLKPESARRIYRSRVNRKLGGVCGGFAEYFDVDPVVVRVLWVAAVLVGGVGIVAYILGWIIIPENPSQTVATKPAAGGQNSAVVWGSILIIVGAFFLIRQLRWFEFFPFRWYYRWEPWFWNFRFDLLLPILIILLGVGYLLSLRKQDKVGGESGGLKNKGEKKMDKKLMRSSTDRMIGGVCGGLAEYFNIDPSLVRIGFALLTLAGGGFLGIVAYIVMLIVIPEEPVTQTPQPSGKTSEPKSKK